MAPMTRSMARRLPPTALSYEVDSSGDPIKIVLSETGQGTRTIWIYPESHWNESSQTTSEPFISAWPTLSTLSTLTASVLSVNSERPHTPGPRESWTQRASMVPSAPKKLQRSPERIGGHRVDFWRDGSGVVVQGLVGHRESVIPQSQPEMNDQEMDATDCMSEMRRLREEREAELDDWISSQGANELDEEDTEMSQDLFDASQQSNSAKRLGPEGTELITESTGISEGDTEMVTDDDEREVRALGLQSTLIVDPSQHETVAPRRTPTSWNVHRRTAHTSRPLEWKSTELIV